VGVWPWRLVSVSECVITHLLNELLFVICVCLDEIIFVGVCVCFFVGWE